MRFTIFRRVTAADWLSLTAALLGFAAVLMVTLGYTLFAAVAMVVAAVVDYIDGRVARRLGGNHDWGREMDSLADIVAFGVAPAFLVWPVIATGAARAGIGIGLAAGFAFPALLIVAGILRLARYNTSSLRGLYIGMPITMNGLIFPAVWALTLGLSVETRAAIFALACAVSAVLMVSDFVIRKR